MQTLISLPNPSLIAAALFGLIAVVQWFNKRVAERALHYQQELIQHQESTINALQEELNNVHIKQKNTEVAQSIGIDDLRERMQRSAYYRD